MEARKAWVTNNIATSWEEVKTLKYHPQIAIHLKADHPDRNRSPGKRMALHTLR
jgi:hypothetical protein